MSHQEFFTLGVDVAPNISRQGSMSHQEFEFFTLGVDVAPRFFTLGVDVAPRFVHVRRRCRTTFVSR